MLARWGHERWGCKQNKNAHTMRAKRKQETQRENMENKS